MNDLINVTVSQDIVFNEQVVSGNAPFDFTNPSNLGTHTSSTLKCLLTNSRSIVNKMEDLVQIVTEENPDLIFITETWGNENIPNAELKLDAYELLRLDRISTRGGGCIIHYKSHLNITVEETLLGARGTESLYCKIKGHHSEILLGVIYNSPANSQEEENNIHEVIREACGKYRSVVIVGDFNHRSIDWNTMHAEREGQPFLDTIQDCFLNQKVDEPTRGENVLDLVLTNNDNLIDNVIVKEPLGMSDHNTVYFDLKLHIDPPNWKMNYKDFRRGDYLEMSKQLNSTNWTELLDDKTSVEDKWYAFKTRLEVIVDEHVPTRTRKKRKQPPWWNEQIRRARKQKVKAWKRYRLTGSNEDHTEYKRTANRNTKEIKKAKIKLEHKLAKNIKTDPKAYFKYIRGKVEAKDCIGPLKNENGEVVNDNSETAALLNNYFASVFTEEITSNVPEASQIFLGPNSDKLSTIEITEEMVKNKLIKLKPDKSPGVDNIYPIVLQKLANNISLPLSIIFQHSLNTGEVPTDWRNANVTPIFKKGPKHKPENYRPISLTSQISKVLEAILRDCINHHLDHHHLIKESQHGFSKGKSCLSNLLLFLEDITKEVDSGKPVDVLYLDFSKAFDKVPHRRLEKKIRAHGIEGNITRWISSWLTGRKQKVVVNGKESQWQNVISGVPQGSVLGPTLFLLFINDIDIGISSKILKFADDTKVYRSVDSVTDIHLLQDDIKKLFKWSEDWQMLFNVDKCKCLHIGHANRNYTYYMNNSPIDNTNEEKDLGIIIQHNLKVSQQVAKSVKNANRALGIIRRNISDKSKYNITRLYKSLVRPHLEYSIQAWRPHLQKDIDNIESVQRRALKMIRGMQNLPYPRRLKETNLITLESRRVRADLIEVYKIINNLEGIPKDKMFIMNTNITRGHELKIYKQRTRLNIRKFFFSQRVIDIWNNLPSSAVKAVSINQFKSAINPIMKNSGGLSISQRWLSAPSTRTTEG